MLVFRGPQRGGLRSEENPRDQLDLIQRANYYGAVFQHRYWVYINDYQAEGTHR